MGDKYWVTLLVRVVHQPLFGDKRSVVKYKSQTDFKMGAFVMFINPLHSDFFWRNINVFVYFVSSHKYDTQ